MASVCVSPMGQTCSLASPVPFPTLLHPSMPACSSVPSSLGLSDVPPLTSSSGFSLEPQSHLFRPPTGFLSHILPLESCKGCLPGDLAVIESRLLACLPPDGLGWVTDSEERKERNWGRGCSEPEGAESKQPGHTLRHTQGQPWVTGRIFEAWK